MNSGIYRIRNLKDGEFYLGSAVNLRRRKFAHFQKLRTNKHANIHLQRAFNRDGEESFIFEILYNCPIEYLIKLEQKCINVFNPHYNICRIANSSLGVKRSEETKRKLKEKRKGRIIPIELVLAGAKKKRKYVCKFSLEGEFIEKYQGIDAAGKLHNIKGSNISNCCRYIQTQAGGFKWRYEGDLRNLKIPINHFKRKVVQKDTNNNIINTFTSVKEAAEKLDIESWKISHYCRGIKHYIPGNIILEYV